MRLSALLPVRHLLTAVALAAALSACGSSGSGTSTEASTTTPAAAASTIQGATKVSANTASQAEIVAALTANGVPNAARWAKEVEEYRPYPKDDPTLARLRQNLEKYKPGDDVMTKILGSLTP
jgi:outer membrane PBP1 activator LpoA protein